MTTRRQAGAWRYGIFALGLVLAACEDETAQNEPRIDPLASMREEQQVTREEITGSTQTAQVTDEETPAPPAEPTEAAEEELPEQPAETAEPVQVTEPAAEERTTPPGTFTADVEEPVDIWEGRLPSGDGRSILIPAVNLFPGSARVDPQIENPYSGDEQAIAAGERHFAAYNCAGCHAPLGGGGMGPPLSDDEWIYGGEPAQIYLSIMHGRGDGMPAWASMLPRKTAWEIVAYIETLDEIENYAAELGFEEGGRYQEPGGDAQEGAGDNAQQGD